MEVRERKGRMGELFFSLFFFDRNVLNILCSCIQFDIVFQHLHLPTMLKLILKPRLFYFKKGPTIGPFTFST